MYAANTKTITNESFGISLLFQILKTKRVKYKFQRYSWQTICELDLTSLKPLKLLAYTLLSYKSYA